MRSQLRTGRRRLAIRLPKICRLPLLAICLLGASEAQSQVIVNRPPNILYPIDCGNFFGVLPST